VRKTAPAKAKPHTGRARRRLAWILLALGLLLLVALVWFGYSADPEITALRNIVHYRVVKGLGGPRLRSGESPGAIAGTVRDAEGEPVPGALVLVSSPLGDTYTATSDAAGNYEIAGFWMVPPILRKCNLIQSVVALRRTDGLPPRTEAGRTRTSNSRRGRVKVRLVLVGMDALSPAGCSGSSGTSRRSPAPRPSGR